MIWKNQLRSGEMIRANGKEKKKKGRNGEGGWEGRGIYDRGANAQTLIRNLWRFE